MTQYGEDRIHNFKSGVPDTQVLEHDLQTSLQFEQPCRMSEKRDTEDFENRRPTCTVSVKLDNFDLLRTPHSLQCINCNTTFIVNKIYHISTIWL